eukprot:1161133-Pelagomonas_calceolata.AAC.6
MSCCSGGLLVSAAAAAGFALPLLLLASAAREGAAGVDSEAAVAAGAPSSSAAAAGAPACALPDGVCMGSFGAEGLCAAAGVTSCSAPSSWREGGTWVVAVLVGASGPLVGRRRDDVLRGPAVADAGGEGKCDCECKHLPFSAASPHVRPHADV